MATRKRKRSKRRKSGGPAKFTIGDRSKLLSLLTRAQRAANKAVKATKRKRKRARKRSRRRYY